MDVSQYLEIFIDETKEHIQSLSDQLMILEQEPENEDCVNEIFRAAHSLKGMAGTMGYKRMQNLTHDMENAFTEVRGGNMKVTGPLIDVLFQALDALEQYLTNIQETSDEGTNDNENIIKAINDIMNDQLGGGGDEKKDEPKAAPEKKEEAAPKTEASEGKWSSISLEEAQANVMSQAIAAGQHVYGLTVYVQESCILKAARAFLVFKAIEELGEIVVSDPSSQDIEDEKFEFDFSLYVISEKSLDKVIAAAKGVSEIENVTGAEIQAGELGPVDSASSSSADASEHTEKKQTASVAVSNAESSDDKKAENKPAASGGAKKPAKAVANRTVRVDIEKLDDLMNLVSELIIAKNSLVSATNSASDGDRNQAVNEQIEYLESVTTNLHESVMKVRMVPIESVVQKFPRMIRDLQKKLDKKMELYMSGEETELDRTVVDEIGDPLMHLLRNSADHGLEPNDVRIQRGKPEVGSIILNAYQDGNNVIIEVKDDGNGIDVEKVKAKAIERGTITSEQAEAMSDKEIVDLLFLPSFSTAKQVTDVSGRGVGLDVVKSKIEALGGDVSVKTKLGEGSTFTIRLPLTLAIIQALMVVVGDEKYAIALGSIDTIEDVPAADIKLVQTKEVMQLRGSVIPLIRLSKELDMESKKDPNDNLVVVVVKKGDNQAGVIVDDLIGQQEIVIKSLGKYISGSKIISGATILGDGEVALIVDTNVLL
ncbi:MAG: chemotaxis protein CheA [Lachnospiraceae bacterium]|nr:chemotaxis protein CheA [Lachnospiraceae bacterium]